MVQVAEVGLEVTRAPDLTKQDFSLSPVRIGVWLKKGPIEPTCPDVNVLSCKQRQRCSSNARFIQHTINAPIGSWSGETSGTPTRVARGDPVSPKSVASARWP